ncbi:hypothetical protein VTN00DRAFT_10124 [Thermoascus crustaceus]|uniref:uncharacterized protein n=1 Tax=Thermoascus crustaceus TaxID=5088 RepID=UPI0037435A3C
MSSNESRQRQVAAAGNSKLVKEGELRRERRGRRALMLETQVQVAVRPSSVIVPPAAVDPPDCRIEACKARSRPRRTPP